MSEMSRHAEFDSAQSPAAGCVDGPAAGSGGAAPGSDNVRRPIGVVRDVAGGTTHIVLDPQRLQECLGDADPAIAMSGQVASQIKIRVGSSWLLGVVRTMRQATQDEDHGGIVVEVDFMGEGDTERLTGNIYGFRRGVTRYPMPGALAHVATSADLRQIYASDGRANISIGTVHPTRDIRAGL